MGKCVQAIQDFLKGKKTYLTAIIAILVALVAWSDDGLSLTQLVTAIFVALQTMFIRAGVSKSSDAAWNGDGTKKRE